MTHPELLARCRLLPTPVKGWYILRFVASAARITDVEVAAATLWDREKMETAFLAAGEVVALPKHASAYSEWAKGVLRTLQRRKGDFRREIMDVLEGLKAVEGGPFALRQVETGQVVSMRDKLYLSPRAFLSICKMISGEVSNHDTSEVLIDLGWKRSTMMDKERCKSTAVWVRKQKKLDFVPTAAPLGPTEGDEPVDFEDIELEF